MPVSCSVSPTRGSSSSKPKESQMLDGGTKNKVARHATLARSIMPLVFGVDWTGRTGSREEPGRPCRCECEHREGDIEVCMLVSYRAINMYLTSSSGSEPVLPKKPVLPSQCTSNTCGMIELADVARLSTLFLSPPLFGFVFGRATHWIDNARNRPKGWRRRLKNKFPLSMHPLRLPNRTGTDP